MLPYASQQQQQPQIHYTSQQQPQIQLQEQHAVLAEPAAPTQQVYSYSHGPSNQQHYQHVKSHEYTLPANVVMPLQTSVDYKPSAPVSYSPKKPSAGITTFQQYYSPGFEYHYTESVPTTKLVPQQSYSYSPSHNYQQNYVQQPSHSYYHSHTPSTASIQSSNIQYNKHQTTAGLLDSYVPSLVSYARQQQQLKNYYLSQQQPQYTQSHQVQQHVQQQAQQHYNPIQHQQLFTPAQTQSHYAPSMTQYIQVPSHNYSPYPSSSAYNTIQYSVPMPAYDHSKRSTAKSTATLKALKSPKKA